MQLAEPSLSSWVGLMSRKPGHMLVGTRISIVTATFPSATSFHALVFNGDC
jgi:hypothetical protein